MIINIPINAKIIRNNEWEPKGIDGLNYGDKFTVYASDWKVLHYYVGSDDIKYPIKDIWIFREKISPILLEVDWFGSLEY